MVKLKKKTVVSGNRELDLLFAESLDLESLAWESGFYQRDPRKITATALFLSFWIMQQLGKNTLRNWANQVGSFIGQSVNKQSVNERFTEKAVELGKLVLKKALNSKIETKKLKKSKEKYKEELRPFNRILIRDSTTQQLPSHLSEYFPGSHSHGNPTAIMRIQALYNFTEEKWEDFEVASYTDNDQGAADCIADLLQPRDLILQDLGYFTLDWIEQLIEHQYLISKWRYATHLFDISGDKIDIVALMEHKTEVDMPVLVGSKHRIPLRLVIGRLPKKKAKERIESARKDRHSKTNHSEEYYELLKYEIYLTNVPPETLNAKQIAKLYGLRWYIETLFKSWKSYANFKKMFDKDRMNLHRTLFTIYALLIQFVHLSRNIYHYVKKQIKQLTNQHLSILKFMDITNDFMHMILNITSIEQLSPLIPQFAAHATYEERKKRKNTMRKYLNINKLCTKNRLT